MLIHIWVLGNKISENPIIHKVIFVDRALIAVSGFRVVFVKVRLQGFEYPCVVDECYLCVYLFLGEIYQLCIENKDIRVKTELFNLESFEQE